MLVDLARARIVKLWIIGMPARIISLHTGASVSTVYRWVRRWQRKDITNIANNTTNSNNNNRGTRRGRPREALRRDMLSKIPLRQLILQDMPPLMPMTMGWMGVLLLSSLVVVSWVTAYKKMTPVGQAEDEVVEEEEGSVGIVWRRTMEMKEEKMIDAVGLMVKEAVKEEEEEEEEGPVRRSMDTMVDAVGVLVGQIVEDRLQGCHIMFLSSSSSPATHSPIVNSILRHITDKARSSLVVVTVTNSGQQQQDLEQSVWGNTFTTCRAIIMYFSEHDNNNNNNNNTELIFSSLERAGLWKLPETRVVMVGPEEGMEGRLFQSSLRNTINCIYLQLTPTTTTPPPTHTHMKLTRVVMKQGVDEKVCMVECTGVDEKVCMVECTGVDEKVCMVECTGVDEWVCMVECTGVDEWVCMVECTGVDEWVCMVECTGVDEKVCMVECTGVDEKVCMVECTDVDERVLVYRRCLYCNTHGQSGVQLLFQWNLTQLHLDRLSQYPHLLNDPLSDLKGHTFRVATISYFPYIDYKRDSEEPGTSVTPLDSVNVRILNALANSLNFTYDMREDPSRSFGNLEADGMYSGMMGQLQREEADFCTMLAPTPGRLKVVDYLRLTPSDAFVIASLKPSVLPANLALVRPFSRNVWVCVMGCVVGWGLVLWMLQGVWSALTGLHSITLDKALEYSWSAIMENSAKDPSVNISGQMLVGWWLVFCLVISTGFRSSLISHLTVQGRSRAPESLGDLVEQEGWTWGTEPWAYNGATLEYFSKHTDPIVKQIHNNMQVLVLQKAMNKVLAGGFSFVIVKNYILVIIASTYTDTYGQSAVYVSKKEFSALACYGWGIRMGAPFLNQFITLHAHLEDTGIIETWTKTIMADRVSSNREKARLDSNIQQQQQLSLQNDQRQVVLSLSHLQGAFYLLGLGCVAGALGLMAELFLLVVWAKANHP
ncbi:hypothetical protein Pcinc_021053 [Petrolisthes cinctipes]|uniref:Ionotropic glutamate receptor L-glutamate and glycine-binding domain-containing protein n=1 Tax=Petrolisthes cinctipes TaxID=88211 RepID=A0AAE1FGN0_PETCI|nr:hypothetical protein Pcinc_021053 [Petrolisthes cinctipes]